jgi:maltooligosyltrehalose trehalohydrolase
MPHNIPEFGAIPLSADRCRFVAWAPEKPELAVVLCGSERRVVSMQPHCGFHITETDARDGARYLYRMQDGREFPDPASRFQPDGVHGASSVANLRTFEWADESFTGHALGDMVIYELHVGTFTPEGSFDAAISRLCDLAELGITTVELMPVAEFPGTRNWGYDGVYPFAAQSSYGGPAGLQRFVDAAHGHGLSVILDVVYNHLGPEGNYFSEFGPFFTDRYRTPWGQAINFDGAESEPVRAFFIQNALYWLDQFHIDGLRLDAVHGIFDFGARHFLAELKQRVNELAARAKRRLHLIAESDLNDARLLHQASQGGYGLDAQWSDDFHHALHSLLTRESTGYYGDFGSLDDLGIAIRDGWRYADQFSRFRKRRHGNSPAGIAPDRLVVFNQNHDQVGNRAMGERLSDLTDFEGLKLAAGVTLLSPFVPLLFMGEEYGEERPFLYFTSHGDLGLVEAVRRGRREEFSSFGWRDEVPDPQDQATFAASVLDYASRDRGPHAILLRLYKSLIALRKIFALGGRHPEVSWNNERQSLTIDYREPAVVAIFNFGETSIPVALSEAASSADPILISGGSEWRGTSGDSTPVAAAAGRLLLGPRSFAVFASHTGRAQ